MTTTTAPATPVIATTAGNPWTEPASTDVVSRFLEQVLGGEGVAGALFTGSAVLDATVPNWRFSVAGPDGIAAQLSAWFAFEQPARFDELRRIPTPTGEVVHFSIEWTEAGVLHAAHQSLTIDLDGGRIADLGLWCGGRWPAPLLAEMEAANMAATR